MGSLYLTDRLMFLEHYQYMPMYGVSIFGQGRGDCLLPLSDIVGKRAVMDSANGSVELSFYKKMYICCLISQYQ